MPDSIIAWMRRRWHSDAARRNAARLTPRLRKIGFEILEDRVVPANFVVTNPGDFSGAHTGTTLRDAINAANASPAADSITFSPSLSSSTISLAGLSPVNGAEFEISGTLSIDGSIPFGAGFVTIDTSAALRFFNNASAATNFSLSDVNLRGGSSSTLGGALLVTTGTMNLTTVYLTSNFATLGGGGLAQTGGNLNTNFIHFNANTTSGSGGGLYVTGGSLITSSDFSFTDNGAGFAGGGFYASGVSRSIFISTSSGNGAVYGGLLSLSGGTYTIVPGSSLSGNSATEGGALYVGITAAATVSVSNTTIANNTATTRGAGVVVNGGSTFNADGVVFGGPNNSNGNSSPNGAALTSAGIVNLTRVTVSHNTGTNSNGGGIRIDAGAATIDDSTISSNNGIAGLYVAGGTVVLVNDTIASNGGSGVFRGGGAIIAGNTIFANNGVDFNGTVTSSGTNLVGNTSGSSGFLPGNDLLNVGALLGPLASNGATAFPSFTHALLPGSPAFNAGNNSLAAGQNLTTDQRNSQRFVSTVDIGAYELLDTIAPTATFNSATSINATTSGTNTTTVVVTYADPSGSGLEAPSGVNPTTLTTNDITVNNGATVTAISVSNNQVTYTIRSSGSSWANSPQGTYTISLTAGGVVDRAGNGIAGIGALGTFVVDTVPPSATLTSQPSNINAATGGGTDNPFTVTLTDAVSGIDLSTINSGDFVAANGGTSAVVNVQSVSGSGNSVTVVYTVVAPGGTWDASAQGTYIISLVPGSVSDRAGNPIAGINSFASFSVNTIRPFATLSGQPANITVANVTPGSNSFTITYSSLGAPLNPATYGANDVTVSNGATTLTVISVSNSSNQVTYVVQAPGGMWTNLPQGQYTIALNGNSVFDTAGNAVPANPTLGFFTVDAYRPTATLTSPPTTINVTYSGPQSNSFTINYSDIGLGVDVTTFGTANVMVANGATTLQVATAMVSSTSVTYVVLAPNNDWATATPGTYTITIVGNSVKDLAGNGITNNPNFAFFLVDLTRPTATLTTPPANINVANSGPGTNTITVTYADTGSGMNTATYVAANLTISNGATTLPVSNVSVSGNVVTYTITPAGGWAAVAGGTYTVALNASAADRAGNTVNPVANFASFTVDVTQPTVTVAPTGTVTNASPIVFTINFSEPVTGLTTAGFTITNGTAGVLTQVTTSQYTLPVTPTADGIVTVTVKAGAAQDASMNPNLVSNTASVTSDRTGPVATFSPPSVAATIGGPVSYTVTWSDPRFSAVTLTAAQVILVRTGTAGAVNVTVTGAGNVRVITLSNVYGNGTIKISLPAGVAVDTLGNQSAAAGPSAAFSVSGNRILNISQPPAPATLLPGSTYVYKITVSNTGNQISPGARVVVNLPPNATFLPAASTAGWVPIGNGLYQLTFGPGLIPGGAAQIKFAVAYSATTPPGAAANFTAYITDNIANGLPVATSKVASIIVDPNRLRWGRT